MDPDTYGYLSPAVHLFGNGTYVSTWRNFLYPSFLILVLQVFPHLGFISKVQHIIGLGTAVIIVLTFFRSRVFLPTGKILDGMVRLVALIGAYVYLLSQSPIMLEHSIRPEALFPFASAMNMLIGLEFSRRVFLKQRVDGLTSTWTILLIIGAIGTYYLKPAWGLAVGASLLPLALAWLWIPNQWVWKSLSTLTGILLSVILFAVPTRILQRQVNGDFFLPTTLLCTHAQFLQDIIQKDALSLPMKSPERAPMLQFAQDIRTAIQSPHYKRYGLTLNPDDLMYRGPLEHLASGLQNSKWSLEKFCYYYYFRSWIEHPLAQIQKVEKQMAYFYSPKKVNIYTPNHSLDPLDQYHISLKAMHDTHYAKWQPLDTYQKSLQNPHFATSLDPHLPHGMRWLMRLLNNLFLAFLLLSLVGVTIVFFGNDLYRKLLPAALCSLYLSSFNFSNCLTISVVHMMSVSRYHFNQISMSVLSQGFEFLFVIALIITYFSRRQLSQPPVKANKKLS